MTTLIQLCQFDNGTLLKESNIIDTQFKNKGTKEINNETFYCYFFETDIAPQFSGQLRIRTGSQITLLYNLSQINSINLPYPLKKIGIQGAPYLPVWINNNCIRLNKNGIYELHNGIDITSVGVFPDANNSFFLIDYEY